jgi:hypothetical protein
MFVVVVAALHIMCVFAWLIVWMFVCLLFDIATSGLHMMQTIIGKPLILYSKYNATNYPT